MQYEIACVGNVIQIAQSNYFKRQTDLIRCKTLNNTSMSKVESTQRFNRFEYFNKYTLSFLY